MIDAVASPCPDCGRFVLESCRGAACRKRRDVPIPEEVSPLPITPRPYVTSAHAGPKQERSGRYWRGP